MKKIFFLLAISMVAISLSAQTLNVKVGNVTYQFPSSQTGDMVYDNGSTLTIMGKAFTISDITSMTVDESAVTDNSVAVAYNGSTANVTISGNVAKYLTPTISGAHVSIEQSADVTEEITYTLSGTSTDGEFYMSGSYKSTIELNGLTLTNATPVYSGAAIHIENGKRINVKPITGTVNTLVDAASGSQKGCLYVKGHIEFKQKGTLNVTGNVKHAIKAGEYISVKNATINVVSALGDGISCNEYFLMESGNITINGTEDDGIQCDIDGTESTGETVDHEDEDSGNIYIIDGTITINCAAIAAKGIKCEGDMIISGGNINVTTTGDGEWDEADGDTSAACGMSADGNFTINGGTLVIKATGSGGKGMKCDNDMVINGGDITIETTGGLYYNNGTTENKNFTGDTDRINSSYYSSPKGIKAGVKETVDGVTTQKGSLVINGGTINVKTAGTNGEGIESKGDLTVNDGTIIVNSYDDGINSAGEMHLKGGTITVATKNNDAIDSNANLYISGGTIIACGAKGAESGLDAAEGYRLYITGGTVLGVGGSNNGVSATTGSQCVLSTTGTVSAGTTISVKSGSTTLATFTVPTTYSPQGNNGGPGGGGPGGGGNNSRSNVLISCAGMTSGTDYTVTIGSSSNNVTASTTSSGNMGGGGWW